MKSADGQKQKNSQHGGVVETVSRKRGFKNCKNVSMSFMDAPFPLTNFWKSFWLPSPYIANIFYERPLFTKWMNHTNILQHDCLPHLPWPVYGLGVQLNASQGVIRPLSLQIVNVVYGWPPSSRNEWTIQTHCGTTVCCICLDPSMAWAYLGLGARPS